MRSGGRVWYSAGTGLVLWPIFFTVSSAGTDYGSADFRMRMLKITGLCLWAAVLLYAAGSDRKWIRWTAITLLLVPPLAFAGMIVWILSSSSS